MASKGWWNRTSAADDATLDDDGYEIVDLDSDDESDDWFKGFNFDDYRPTSKATIGGFWGRYSAAVDRTDSAARIASAQRIVQGFVDTFATGDLPYRVTFSETVTTAGTDFKSRSVVVSHKPLFDPTLTEDEANTVLTAMAVHESSHVRYGKHTAEAVERADWGVNRAAALRISNILDDVRIERRFVEDYPGYTEVFEPALAYVARTTAGTVAPTVATMAPIDQIVASIRYAAHCDFTGAETVRDSWIEWSERGTADDTAETHVAAVREAIDRLVAEKQERESEQSTDQQPGEGQGGEGESLDGDDSQTGEGGEPTQNETGDVSTETEIDPTSEMGGCFGEAIEKAAEENGETSGMTDDDAQDLVEQAKAMVDDGQGGKGEAYWSADGIASDRDRIAPNSSAASAIRAAFMRSRTGHFDTERGMKSGRIDNRSLARVASNDYRLFNRRTAPSEGRYLVWLLVDCSGSMDGRPVREATSVAAALAAASRGLPTLRLDIWGWTTAFRLQGCSFGAARVWTTGQEIASIGALPNIPMGGTPDAQTLSWAGRAIAAQARRDETPVIIIASDGQGTLSYSPEIVEQVRRTGVKVVSVAIGNGVSPEAQERMFGAGNFVPWAGSIAATAGPLGKMIARIVSGR